MKSLATVWDVQGWDSARKWAYLRSLSITTMITFFVPDLGKPLIKSIEMEDYTMLGIGRGAKRLG
jgi:hypothetical protein